jgi:anaphase-promoting complex subunit 1
MQLGLTPFVTIGNLLENTGSDTFHIDRWSFLTPRTAIFHRFFSSINSSSGPVEIVEKLYASNGTAEFLDSLPESVLIPLREAITSCQASPPVTWGADLLSLVDRKDVNMLLFPELQRRISAFSILVS